MPKTTQLVSGRAGSLAPDPKLVTTILYHFVIAAQVPF